MPLDFKDRYAKEFLVGWRAMDVNGHMANTAYLDLAADVRLAFLADHGFPPTELRRLAIGPVIRKEELEYFREVNLHETVTVTYAALAMSADGARFVIENEIWSANGERAATVHSTGGWLRPTRPKAGRPSCRAPRRATIPAPNGGFLSNFRCQLRSQARPASCRVRPEGRSVRPGLRLSAGAGKGKTAAWGLRRQTSSPTRNREDSTAPAELPKSGSFDVLAGGGEMGALMRTIDWANTPLGPVETWSQTLKTMVSFLLANRFPICSGGAPTTSSCTTTRTGRSWAPSIRYRWDNPSASAGGRSTTSSGP